MPLNDSHSSRGRQGITTRAAHGLARQVPPASRPVVLHGAVIVDATTDSREPSTIVIVEGFITDVASSDRANIPAEALTINLDGRFVIPGLWDMHVHQFDADYLPFHLLNGVTGIRHMGGIPAHHQWREDLRTGRLTSPRMVLASPIIDGPQPLRPGSIAVHDAESARQAVTESRTAGADFLKIYNLIPQDAFAALVDEARRNNIPYAGHLPLVTTLAETAAQGQASIEHLEGLLVAGARDADRLQSEIAKLTVGSLAEMQQVQDRVTQAAKQQDTARAEAICAELATQGVWNTPTLAVLHASATAGTDDFPLENLLDYVEPHLRPIWEQVTNAEVSHSQQEQRRTLFETQLDAVARLHRHGVGLLAGTDTFVPGFSLHDELELFVRAGLSPLEALTTATYNPAAFFGVTDTFGTIQSGRVADLVVLNSDPLEDITNTRRISGVMLAGRYYDETALANLKTKTMASVRTTY
ncbi:amidohydrolase family protein [Corynebacterium glyciniphilum]|uniref:amidohydrolase family protein n=1 Tax=Corynebacterium glyciniphilum TaxID=1404244 RepID=UPI003DA1AFBE